MIPISEAIEIVERETAPLETERVALLDSVGRVLASDVVADMDLPPFDRSQMDGFALRSSDVTDVPTPLVVIGESVAGRGFDGVVDSGQCVRIMTGARLPEGADAVQKVESTRETDGVVEILEAPKAGRNINRRGTEIECGATVFRAGEHITDQMIAALASFGVAQPHVFRRPRIGILSTGTEIVGIDDVPQRDQIRNSNSSMLAAYCAKVGASAEILPHVHDDFDVLANTIAAACPVDENARRFDILIATGGVSVGDYDFTKPALRELGAEIFFEKVSLKPGKPTVFARLGNTLVFGLPGNPVSVAVTFHLFVRRAVMMMQSATSAGLRSGTAVCSSRIKSAKERDCFLPVVVASSVDGKLIVESLRFTGSSNFVAFARANALVFVPRGRDLEEGETADVLFL